VAGATVVFHAPDGIAYVERTTDRDGRASAPVSPGSSVTAAAVIRGFGYSLFSVLDVQPGETIPIRAGFVPEPRAIIGNLAVTLPGSAGGPSYSVYIGRCDGYRWGADAPVLVTLFEECRDPATGKLKIVAVAHPWTAGDPYLAYSVATVDVPADMKVTMPAWRTDFRDDTLALSGIPAGLVALSTSARTLDPGAEYRLWFDVEPGRVEAPPSTLEQRVRFPQVATGGSAYQLSLWRELDGAELEIRATQTPPAYRLDLSRELLPRVRDVDINVSGAAPVVWWTADGSMARAQGAMIWITTGAQWEWNVLMPSTTAPGLTLPRLPESLAAYRVPGPVAVHLVFLHLDILGGYQDLKREIGPKTYLAIDEELEGLRAFTRVESYAVRRRPR
jgi:hypothetical protein